MVHMRFLQLSSLTLRALELASAVVVVGITGFFLAESDAGAWNNGRLIYTEVVGAVSLVSILLVLVSRLEPFFQIFLDILLSFLWWSVSGLLLTLREFPCDWVFEWMNVAPFDEQCGKFTAEVAFAVVSATLYLASGMLNALMERHLFRQQVSDVRSHYLKREMRQSQTDSQV
ncbi:uncharacterized protein UV8b_02777 [Ustilaginoidea virens]|uniref:MARVEL domain-containing protein n=1 Tax=Ustilaginoidea virens TaxID=1159556 RepID=A0A8E5HN89_USTVR|nr:uncharacterized protein UV8b_02777 [Ustilaginoidea virens]QUC18536.1 hypothetical protein UV8b_02777 [Ustilaginoidea virens]